MYEYKIFEAKTYSPKALNELLEAISQDGWEPIQLVARQILARRLKVLND